MGYYPTGRKVSLEFIFRYFASGKFAKYKFRLLSDFRNLSMTAYTLYPESIHQQKNSPFSLP